MLRRLTAGRARLMAGAFTMLAMVICAGFPASGERQGGAPEDSAEMKRIYDADQADRQINIGAMTPQQLLDWTNKVGPRDAQRRRQVRDLIARGAFHTGVDFDEAAVVFQHGDNPSDYLLAHTLAIVAVAKGSSKSRWMAAATLDRYLQAVKQRRFLGPNTASLTRVTSLRRSLTIASLYPMACASISVCRDKLRSNTTSTC